MYVQPVANISFFLKQVLVGGEMSLIISKSGKADGLRTYVYRKPMKKAYINRVGCVLNQPGTHLIHAETNLSHVLLDPLTVLV